MILFLISCFLYALFYSSFLSLYINVYSRFRFISLIFCYLRFFSKKTCKNIWRIGLEYLLLHPLSRGEPAAKRDKKGFVFGLLFF